MVKSLENKNFDGYKVAPLIDDPERNSAGREVSALPKIPCTTAKMYTDEFTQGTLDSSGKMIALAIHLNNKHEKCKCKTTEDLIGTINSSVKELLEREG